MQNQSSSSWSENRHTDPVDARLWSLAEGFGEDLEVDTDAGWNQLQARLRQENAQRPHTVSPPPVETSTRLRTLWKYAAIAAAAVLLLVFANVLSDSGDEVQLYTNTGKDIRQVELLDRSTVLLRPDSRLTFTSSANERRAQLLGEAAFEVEPNPNQPFILEHRQFNLVVVGTRFAVRNLSPRSSSVVVTEGHVRLQGKHEADWVDLYAGDSIRIEDLRLVLPPAVRESAEKEDFTNTPLEEVAVVLAASRGLRIVLPEQLKSCTLTANFTGMSDQTVVKTIAVLFGATATRDKEQDSYRISGGICD